MNETKEWDEMPIVIHKLFSSLGRIKQFGVRLQQPEINKALDLTRELKKLYERANREAKS